MFKNLKDRLAKEVKQSPMKITSSVQQFAQAVVDRTTSNNIQDQFSIDDSEDTPQNSPSKFHSVDLVSPTPSVQTRSRRDSLSSVTSEASSIFPVLDSNVTFHLQSDFESASEVEDNFNSQLDRINKEHLFNAYKRTQLRYQKYKSRFQELANHYRDLEREHIKAKHILTECQDKAIRRIGELKEQCILEQKAKAHLEEALRNDIEEKDHHIAALKTKISLLKAGQDHLEQSKDELLIDLNEESESSSETDQNLPSEKITKLETLLLRYKEILNQNTEKIQALEQEKYEFKKNCNSPSDVEFLKKSLTDAQILIKNLNETIESLKQREQENALSIAENKLSIHKELEKKEEKIKHLQECLEIAQKEKEEQSLYIIDEIKENLMQDLSKSNTGAIQSIQEEMKQKIIDLQNKMDQELKLKTNKILEIDLENKQLSEKLQTNEDKSNTLNKIIDDLNLNINKKDNKIKLLSKKLDDSKERESLLEKKVKDFEKTVHELDELRDKLNEESTRFVKLTEDFDILSLSGHKKEQEIFQLSQEKISLEKDLEQNMIKNKHLIDKYEILLETIQNLKLSKHQIFNVFKSMDNTIIEDFNNLKIYMTQSINDFVINKQSELKENYEKNINYLKIDIAKLKEELEFKNNLTIQLQQDLECEIKKNNTNQLEFNQELNNKSLESFEYPTYEDWNKFQERKCKEIEDLRITLEENYKKAEKLSEKLQLEIDFNNEIKDKMKVKIVTLNKEISKKDIDLKNQQERINNLTNLELKLSSEIIELKNQIQVQGNYCDELSSKLNISENVIENNNLKLIDYENQHINLKEKINDLENKHSQFVNQLEEKCNNIKKSTKEETVELVKKIQILEETNNLLTSKNGEFKSQINGQNEIINNLKINLNKTEEELLKYKDLYIDIENRFKTMNEQHSELVNESNLLKKQHLEFNDLKQIINQLKSDKSNISVDNSKLSNELFKQNEKLKEIQALKICLEDKIKELDDNLKLTIEENAKLSIHNQKLLSNSSDSMMLKSLKEELSECKIKIKEISEINSCLDDEIKQYKEEINILKQEELQLKNLNEQLSQDKSSFEQKIAENNIELENEMSKIKDNLKYQIEELNLEKSHLKKKLSQTLTECSNEKQELENNLFEIKQKLEEFQSENSDLKLQLNISIESSVKELEKHEQKYTSEKKNLEEQIKIQNERYSELEEAHRLKIKQLVIDFEKQLAKTKEESISDKEKFIDTQESYESQQMRELREQIKLLETELEERHLNFESHEQKSNSKLNEFSTQIRELEAALDRANAARTKELAECESRWRNCLERELEQERIHHQDQLQILQSQWEWERSKLKSNGNSELQSTSHIAVKAIESGSGSFEMLQQQFIAQSQELKELKRQHRLEIQELKKFHSIKHKTSGSTELEDATELEYLRNILYEYMMGREPLVLAKVISAVVKFDNEQTNKILQKEEQKLTLLGHLGFSN